MTQRSDQHPDASRRAFVTRAAYMAPAILTLAAAPSYAKAGSEKPAETPTDTVNPASTDSVTAPPTRTGRHHRHHPRPPVGGDVAPPPV